MSKGNAWQQSPEFQSTGLASLNDLPKSTQFRWPGSDLIFEVSRRTAKYVICINVLSGAEKYFPKRKAVGDGVVLDQMVLPQLKRQQVAPAPSSPDEGEDPSPAYLMHLSAGDCFRFRAGTHLYRVLEQQSHRAKVCFAGSDNFTHFNHISLGMNIPRLVLKYRNP